MVQTRKMNEAFFVKMQKDLTATGELIRAKQDEKQALLDEFDNECKRFFFGKISQRALLSSIKKTNTELQRLDNVLRDSIKKCRSLSNKEMKLISSQAPIGYRATLSGISGGKSKTAKKTKVVRKKTKAKTKARNQKKR